LQKRNVIVVLYYRLWR